MLEDLCKELHDRFIEENKGVAEKVLFESTDRKGMMEGYTGNYIRVSQPYNQELIGQIVNITI
jgi:threonylcarbamoyladenosine tRNA methylthiotransferase MtaB